MLYNYNCHFLSTPNQIYTHTLLPFLMAHHGTGPASACAGPPTAAASDAVAEAATRAATPTVSAWPAATDLARNSATLRPKPQIP